MFSTTFLGSIFSDDPQLRLMQMLLAGFGSLFLFLLLFTLRDILLRTRSFAYQLFSIAIVALLPGLGFLLYLLLRPARTIREREMEAMVRSLTAVIYSEEAEEGEDVDGSIALTTGENEDVDDSEEGEDNTEDSDDNESKETDSSTTLTTGESKDSEESDDAKEGDKEDGEQDSDDKKKKHAHTHRRSHS